MNANDFLFHGKREGNAVVFNSYHVPLNKVLYSIFLKCSKQTSASFLLYTKYKKLTRVHVGLKFTFVKLTIT